MDLSTDNIRQIHLTFKVKIMCKQTFLILITVLISVQMAWTQFTSKWYNGYKVDSEDGQFKMKFGGRMQYDIAAFNPDQYIVEEFG